MREDPDAEARAFSERKRNELYIVLWDHMNFGERLAQTAHAAAVFAATSPSGGLWSREGTVKVLVAEARELELLSIATPYRFNEPDLNDALVSVSFHNPEGDALRILNKLKLAD